MGAKGGGRETSEKITSLSMREVMVAWTRVVGGGGGEKWIYWKFISEGAFPRWF